MKITLNTIPQPQISMQKTPKHYTTISHATRQNLKTAAEYIGLATLFSKICHFFSKKKNSKTEIQPCNNEAPIYLTGSLESQLDSLEKLSEHRPFDYRKALSEFKVPENAFPIKREGADMDGNIQAGKNYKEFYKSDNGTIIEAGVKYYTANGLVDSNEYTCQYVKCNNPTTPGQLCEIRRIHLTAPDGQIIEYTIEPYLSYSREKNKNPKIEISNEFVPVYYAKKQRTIPPEEQEYRRKIYSEAQKVLNNHNTDVATPPWEGEFDIIFSFDPVTGEKLPVKQYPSEYLKNMYNMLYKF